MTIEDAIALVAQLLERGRLTKVQELVFRQSWAGRTYLEIASESDYDAGHIKDTGAELWRLLSKALSEKVTKHNLVGVLQQAARQRNPGSLAFSVMDLSTHTDWGDAIDVSIFYGRDQELTTLKQWLVQDRCRLVTLIGMGGMGKTSLSVKLAEAIQTEFDCLIWRSLRDAPPIDDLLTTLIQFLSQQQDTLIPDSIGGKLSRLIELLQRSRCLVILDNFETVLQSGKWAGTYRNGYEDYGELLKRVGDIVHQSCMVLTSREKPQEVSTQASDRLPIRVLPLSGLDIASGQQILEIKGLHGAPADLEQLIAHYRGNPLALKLAATSIQDLFAGNIEQFLDEKTTGDRNGLVLVKRSPPSRENHWRLRRASCYPVKVMLEHGVGHSHEQTTFRERKLT